MIRTERNILEHLPQALRPSIRRALRQAWASSSADTARRQLERLAASLRTNPLENFVMAGAANVLRVRRELPGLEEIVLLPGHLVERR